MASKFIAVWPQVRVFPVDGDPVTVSRGDLLPGGISTVELDNLVSFGAIAGVTGLPATDADAQLDVDPALFDPTKGGGVKETMVYVGTDKARAAAMLELELAKGDKARPTLVEPLEAIVTDPGAGS